MDEVGITMRERAPRIRRGVARHFTRLGCAVVAEMPLTNGRRADLVALDGKGGIAIVEIKSGTADLAADRKWPEYEGFCDRLYFAVDTDFPRDRLPEGTGVVVADAYDAEITVEAPLHTLNAARRKAMTLRFARLAAARLLALTDPAAQLP